ncbi:hypothetical protein MM1218R_03537 [Mycobacterium marinum]|nr:hypothetical protein MM1218R_03537 [Mycobacterium marinum]AXN50748.1 hypothetical protein CCUG20998_03345 [Mycobacterium marinum]BBC66749.1 hypothetical protein MMRN_36450 [Mycobacterium marinum]CDM77522.1 Transposase, IS30 family [Mycobacterium marinum E11]
MACRQQAADRVIRPKLRSPGHRKYRRHVEVAFWEQIARGLLAEEAAGIVGVASGGRGTLVPQRFDVKFQPSGRCLSFAECEEIALLRVQGNVFEQSSGRFGATRPRSHGNCAAAPLFATGAAVPGPR